MKQWNQIFKTKGKVFTGLKEGLPEFVELLKKQNAKRVLDLGSGSGRHIIYFAKQGFDTYGIDIADEGIKITKKWLKKEKWPEKKRIGKKRTN